MSGAAVQGRLTPATLLALAIAGVGGVFLLAPGLLAGASAGAAAVADPTLVRAAALTLTAVGLLATNALPTHITALLFMLLAMLLELAPARVVFAGFQSTAFWLLFSGLVIGVAIRHSGIATRLARRVAAGLGGSYPKLVTGLALAGLALAFVMPSAMGRIMILVPIVIALAERLGFEAGSRGRTGLVLAASFGTFFPAFAILPSNVANMVLIGAAETLYDYKAVYGHYFITHFPVMGALKLVVIIALILALFPAETPSAPDRETSPAVTRTERRLALLVTVALVLWATDFLHGVSPAWVGLGVAVICLLPGAGLLPDDTFNTKINYASLFYVGGILGMGAVVAETGVGDALGGALLAVANLKPDAPGYNFAAMTGISTLVGMIATLPGLPAVMVPLADNIAQATGWSLEMVLMVQVIGMTSLALPYQSPPLVVALHLSGVRIRDAARATLILSAVTLLLLAPLDYLWWRLIGLL